jgi:hypothetical protein
VRDDAEQELPRPYRLEAEELVAEEAGRRCDHDQLEDRPPDALEDVERRREIRAAASEWRPLQHHCRHARVRADQRGKGEHQIPDHGPDERRGERVAQRQIEVGGQDEHQQRDPEVRPEERRVHEAEDTQAIRNRLDSPLWCVPHYSLPSLVLTRSGSTGVISAPFNEPQRTPASVGYPAR